MNRLLFHVIVFCCSLIPHLSHGQIALLKSRLLGDTATTTSAKESDASALASNGNNSNIDLSINSPRAHFYSFLQNLRQSQWTKAIAFLDLRHIPPQDRVEIGREYCVKLKYIFDRRPPIDLSLLSNDPQGERNDALPFYRDYVTDMNYGDQTLPLYLDKIRSDHNESTWRISPLTLREVDSFYDSISNDFFAKYLPSFFFEQRLLGLPLWQWVFVLLLLPLSLVAGRLLLRLFFHLVGPLEIKTLLANLESGEVTEQDVEKLHEILRPAVSFFFSVVIFSLGIFTLKFNNLMAKNLALFLKTLNILGLTWMCYAVVDCFHYWMSAKLAIKKNQKNGQMLLGKKTLKFILGFISALLVIQNLGFDVTAIFAGLGIGGIAVALAGQKTIENLFGGIVLLTDRPIKVGEFGKFGGYQGHVEEIGWRSTRVRTLDRTIITIPNAEFSQMSIENFKKRDNIRLYKIINLRYETSPNQIRYIIMEIRKLLLAHPRVDKDPARVRFVDFGSSSLDLEIFAYILTDELAEFMAIREDIYLRILEIISSCGSAIAFPSQTIYMDRNRPGEPHLVQEVERKVSESKKKGELCLPDFPEEEIARLSNSLTYPPPESVFHKTFKKDAL